MHSDVATTIRISSRLAKALAARKRHARETYEQVLHRMIEDLTELDEATKRDIEEAERAVEAGDVKTQEQVRKELGL